MALVANNLLSENGSGTSFTTASSLTPTPGRVYFARVVNRGTNTVPTVTGGGGLTWVQVDTKLTGGANPRRVTVFRACKTSGLTSGTVTADFAGNSQTRIFIDVDEWTGADSSGTNGSGSVVQSVNAVGSGTGSSVTLAAFSDALNNAPYQAVVHNAAEAQTPEVPYTETSAQQNSATAEDASYKVGQDLTVTTSWSTNTDWAAIAIEVKAAPPELPLIQWLVATVASAARNSVFGGRRITPGPWKGTPASPNLSRNLTFFPLVGVVPHIRKLAALHPRARRNPQAPHYKLRPPAVVEPTPLVTDPRFVVRRYLQAVKRANRGGNRRQSRYVLRPPRVIFAAPVNTVPPAITGECIIGNSLTVSTGTWVPAPSFFTYQWQRSADDVTWADIPGATNSFYVIQNSDYTFWIRCIVTAHGATGGTSSAVSDECGPVSIPIIIRPPTNVLGCGKYDALILERGGGSVVGEVEWTGLEASRVLDDTSEATVTGTIGTSETCCDLLAQVKPWRHELAIYRDEVLLWVGPVVNVTVPPGQFQISARDLSAWWDRRLIHESHQWDEVDLGEAFQTLFEDAMAPDTSPNITLSITRAGITGAYRVSYLQHQMAGAALRELTNIGVDWTVIGREVRAGGLVVPTSGIGVFLDEHFANPPTPTLSGENQANAPLVRGAGGGVGGDRVFAQAFDNSSILLDGLLESAESVQTITDFNSATQAADTQLELRKAISQVNDGALISTAPFTVDELIPGALCRISLNETCIPVHGEVRLKSVQFHASSGTDDSVTLNFQPTGTTTAEEAVD